MLSEQLLADLHKLSRAEKLRVVQALVGDLAHDLNAEETQSTNFKEAEIWSPLEAYEAAQIMQAELDEYKRRHAKP
ncbi:MAG: hypothetical protein KF716_07620 [Anaerolineae bacterium]|nr:hypothetical protein [Anaerolineae bacterium]